MPPDPPTFDDLLHQTAIAIDLLYTPPQFLKITNRRRLLRQTLAGYAAALETLFDADNHLPMETLPVFPIQRYEKPRPPAA